MIDTLIYERDCLVDEYDDQRAALCELCDHAGYVADMHGDDESGYICFPCDHAEQSEYHMSHRRFR
jgi:hypothetical protein